MLETSLYSFLKLSCGARRILAGDLMLPTVKLSVATRNVLHGRFSLADSLERFSDIDCEHTTFKSALDELASSRQRTQNEQGGIDSSTRKKSKENTRSEDGFQE